MSIRRILLVVSNLIRPRLIANVTFRDDSGSKPFFWDETFGPFRTRKGRSEMIDRLCDHYNVQRVVEDTLTSEPQRLHGVTSRQGASQ